jgi:hypothetical protein
MDRRWFPICNIVQLVPRPTFWYYIEGAGVERVFSKSDERLLEKHFGKTPRRIVGNERIAVGPVPWC